MDFRALIPDYIDQEPGTYDFKFTVFTSVYNAEATIERTHESLLNQSLTDFEWLVINDGSTDNTDAVMNKLVASSPLKIHYVNNPLNKHKMSCFLQAVKLAKGQFFLTFDADDQCMPEALQVFNEEYESIPDDKKENVIAVTGLCIDEHGNKVGDDYPSSPYYSDPFEIYAIDKIDGEKWGFTLTDKLRGVHYKPEFFDHGYIPEGLIWNVLGMQGFKTKYINKVLRTYHIGIENSISNSPLAKTAVGSTINYLANINWFFENYWFKTPLFFLKNLYYILRFSNYQPYRRRCYTKSIDPGIMKILFTLLWPFRSLVK
ncbi:MAG: glycosyltransferase family 2 protein [Flavobacteriaceae bacterium]|nr:glycosyltransferase family 2 protein [Flavobacteriaceae bacterium]